MLATAGWPGQEGYIVSLCPSIIQTFYLTVLISDDFNLSVSQIQQTEHDQNTDLISATDLSYSQKKWLQTCPSWTLVAQYITQM